MNYMDIIRQAAGTLREGGKAALAEQVQSLGQEIEGYQHAAEKWQKQEHDMLLQIDELKRKAKEMLELFGFAPGEMEFHDGLLWIIHDPLRRDRTRTAICQKCWQADKRVMRHVVEQDGKESGFECQACGAANRSIKERANRP